MLASAARCKAAQLRLEKRRRCTELSLVMGKSAVGIGAIAALQEALAHAGLVEVRLLTDFCEAVGKCTSGSFSAPVVRKEEIAHFRLHELLNMFLPQEGQGCPLHHGVDGTSGCPMQAFLVSADRKERHQRSDHQSG